MRTWRTSSRRRGKSDARFDADDHRRVASRRSPRSPHPSPARGVADRPRPRRRSRAVPPGARRWSPASRRPSCRRGLALFLPPIGPRAHVALLLLHCRWPACSRGFLICSRCYRGQRYCSHECSSAGRTESVKRARRKYVPPAEVVERRRRLQREAYARRRRALFSADQTSRGPPTATKVIAARGTDVDPARAKVTHAAKHAATRSFNPSAPRLGFGSPRCSRCGAPSLQVLTGTRRLRR
jgi:hypothetical protein